MSYWLVKSEPSTYSWQQFIKDKKTIWSGVRNYAARNFLREMRLEDNVFFYHSNEGLEIIGIARVFKESYQDPTTNETKWVAVDLVPVRKLQHAISLNAIKNEKRLANMALVRLGRLSVQPVTIEEWGIILAMSGEK